MSTLAFVLSFFALLFAALLTAMYVISDDTQHMYLALALYFVALWMLLAICAGKLSTLAWHSDQVHRARVAQQQAKQQAAQQGASKTAY